MKISELIEKLETLKEEHGDEEVRVIADAKQNEFMKLRQNEITHGDINRIEAGYRRFVNDDELIKFIFIFAG